ncbi:MAG: amidohydrolase family protein, partial [Beijerinckiaceae bacterium]
DELRQLEYSQRLAERGRNVLAERGGSTARRLFDLAAAGGAQACGAEIGAIAAGRRADIVVLDTSMPEFAGRRGDEALDTFVFGARRSAVRDVFAGGRHVVREGRHVHRDAVEAGYRRSMSRLLPAI